MKLYRILKNGETVESKRKGTLAGWGPGESSGF